MSLLRKIGLLIFPADSAIRLRRFELTIWAFLLSLAYYPDYFGFIAWLALIRPFIIISKLKIKAAFNSAYLFSFMFNIFSLYWVGIVTIPGMVAAVVIVAFYYSAALVMFNIIFRHNQRYGLIALPFLWVGVEYFRMFSEFAFPWSDLGYTQSYYLLILQIVSVVSVHGLSFLIIIVNILLWQFLRKELSIEKRLTSILFSAAIIVGLIGYGWVVMPPYEISGKHKVAVLQPSIPINVKWQQGNAFYSYNFYDSLTNSVKDSGVNLFVWPETSAPTALSHDFNAQKIISRTARNSKADHLVGSLGITFKEGIRQSYNSCYHFDQSGKLIQRYDKMKLVPFSEHVPYQDNLPFLQKGFLEKYLTFIKTYDVQWWSNFYPGDSMKLFTSGDYHYSAIICFESTFPEFVRQTILDGADFIVGITNDTWFKTSVGVHMHSRIFLTRAVENRVWGLRAANSGISYIVDDYGRIRNQLALNEVNVIVGNINPLENRSFFTKYGDIIGRLSLLITLSLSGILILLWLIKKIKS